jgi:hypothetical protein
MARNLECSSSCRCKSSGQSWAQTAVTTDAACIISNSTTHYENNRHAVSSMITAGFTGFCQSYMQNITTSESSTYVLHENISLRHMSCRIYTVQFLAYDQLCRTEAHARCSRLGKLYQVLLLSETKNSFRKFVAIVYIIFRVHRGLFISYKKCFRYNYQNRRS